jgi:AcrR family transcriptional regulator
MDDEPPRVLRLLWGHEEPKRRGPKPAMTVHDIGAAAVKIADTDGLAAVSMSRVAGDLGYTTMSLYRYVSSKDDLYIVMLDEAYGAFEVKYPARAGWRRRITLWAEAARDVLLRHPWVLQIPLSEPPLSPHQVGWMEAGLQAFADTGLTHQQKLSSMLLVDVYVRGITGLMSSVITATTDEGLTEAEADQLYAKRLDQLVDPERYPAVAAALGSGALSDSSDSSDPTTDEFAFGLKRVLDGIGALVDS